MLNDLCINVSDICSSNFHVAHFSPTSIRWLPRVDEPLYEFDRSHSVAFHCSANKGHPHIFTQETGLTLTPHAWPWQFSEILSSVFFCASLWNDITGCHCGHGISARMRRGIRLYSGRLPWRLYIFHQQLSWSILRQYPRGWNCLFLWCYFEHSRIGHVACCWLKRRITRGGISVLISPPWEAISLRGQRRGLPIIQGQGGGNGEG